MHNVWVLESRTMGMELFILPSHFPYGRNILVSKSWFGEPSEGSSFLVIGNSVLPELGKSCSFDRGVGSDESSERS